jgi:hypothetical protein
MVIATHMAFEMRTNGQKAVTAYHEAHPVFTTCSTTENLLPIILKVIILSIQY